MALINGGRYPAAGRIGTNTTTGKPVFLQHDPCGAATGVKLVRRIGTNLATGKPVYALRDCISTAPAVGTRYTGAKRIGTNTTSGKPVFALGCQSCGPPCAPCSGVVLPTTLFATFSDGACPNGCISAGFVLPPDMTFDYHSGTNTWRGCAQRPWPFSAAGAVYPNPCPFPPEQVETPIATVRGVISCGASQFSASFQYALCAIGSGFWSEMPCHLAFTHTAWSNLVGFSGLPLDITSCSPLVLSGSHRCINPGFCMDYEVTG